MSVTIHPDGGLLIDDQALEATIAAICKITGETPEEAVASSVLQALRKVDRGTYPAIENTGPAS